MSFLVHSRDSLFDSFCAAAHDNDNVFRVGCAYVVEKVIASARKSRNFVHHLLNDCGNFIIIFISRLSVLEVCIAVLSCTLLNRMIGV